MVRLLPLVYFVCTRGAFTLFFNKIALIKNKKKVGSSDDTIADTEPYRNGSFVAKTATLMPVKFNVPIRFLLQRKWVLAPCCEGEPL
jgi:hypothetical protein